MLCRKKPTSEEIDGAVTLLRGRVVGGYCREMGEIVIK